MSCIYIIKNTINDKVYIGQTKNTAEKRFSGHKADCSRSKNKTYFIQALRKHGKENFYVETLIEGDFDKEKLNELETFYIKEYNSVAPNGYNLQDGGGSFNMSEETKKKISEAHKGKPSFWKDKTNTVIKKMWENSEYREKQAASRAKNRGKYKPTKLSTKFDSEYITKLFQEGNNMNQIAKLLNTDQKTIKRRLKFLGLLENYIPPHEKYSELDIKLIIKMYNDCMNINQIAKHFNVNYSLIKRRLKDLGLLENYISLKRDHSELDVDLINSLYNDGMTIAQLSKHFGVGYGAIKRRIVNFKSLC